MQKSNYFLMIYKIIFTKKIKDIYISHYINIIKIFKKL